MKKMSIFVLVVLALSGCASMGQLSVEEFGAIADENLTAYGEALETRDLEGYLVLHDEDVIKMAQDAPPLVGIDSLREVMQKAMEAVDILKFTAESEEYVVCGDYGYARGLYTVERRLRANQQDLPDFNGKYLTIYRKQPDGTWKIFRDSYSSNTAPGE